MTANEVSSISRRALSKVVRNGKKPLEFTNKQREFLKKGNKKYNIKVGATGSGKTFLDFWNIPKRIIEADVSAEKKIFIMGHSQTSVKRNIIEPMQNIYGRVLVSDISSDGSVKMFGKRVYVVGAGKSNSASAFQGVTIAYVYGDEVTTWSYEAWNMLKSRLRSDGAMMDAACNPVHPAHWFNQFIISKEKESPEEIFHQKYTIWDGKLDEDPEIDLRLKRSIASEYTGVFYDRFILGLWANSEGLIYEEFARTYEDSLIDKDEVPKDLTEIVIGVDFGNSKSKHAFVATAFANGYRDIYVLKGRALEPNITSNRMADEYVDFLLKVENDYGRVVSYTYADNAVQMNIRDMREALYRSHLTRDVRNSVKGRVVDRISLFTRTYNLSRVKFVKGEADVVVEALKGALWDNKVPNKRLEAEGTDVLDAFEYSYSARMDRIMSTTR